LTTSKDDNFPTPPYRVEGSVFKDLVAYMGNNDKLTGQNPMQQGSMFWRYSATVGHPEVNYDAWPAFTEAEQRVARQLLQVIVPFIPLVGQFVAGIEIGAGRELFTGKELTTLDKTLNFIGAAAVVGQGVLLAVKSLSAGGQASQFVVKMASEAEYVIALTDQVRQASTGAERARVTLLLFDAMDDLEATLSLAKASTSMYQTGSFLRLTGFTETAERIDLVKNIFSVALVLLGLMKGGQVDTTRDGPLNELQGMKSNEGPLLEAQERINIGPLPRVGATDDGAWHPPLLTDPVNVAADPYMSPPPLQTVAAHQQTGPAATDDYETHAATAEGPSDVTAVGPAVDDGTAQGGRGPAVDGPTFDADRGGGGDAQGGNGPPADRLDGNAEAGADGVAKGTAEDAPQPVPGPTPNVPADLGDEAEGEGEGGDGEGGHGKETPKNKVGKKDGGEYDSEGDGAGGVAALDTYGPDPDEPGATAAEVGDGAGGVAALDTYGPDPDEPGATAAEVGDGAGGDAALDTYGPDPDEPGATAAEVGDGAGGAAAEGADGFIGDAGDAGSD
jgi:hypothetical protein